MIDYDAGDLLIQGNDYHVKHKKHFTAYATMLLEDKMDSFEFAYKMSYEALGEHRDSRSGGTIHRTKGQIFINTFQGKMAEFALYRYLQRLNIDVKRPDVETYEKGKWDSFDLECQGKHMSIKSTKSYSDLLLLETKDWNENGEYIPNLANGDAKYDYTLLVRIRPNGDDLMHTHGLLYQKNDEIPENIKALLYQILLDKNWEYDFPGFIYHSELVKLIRQNRVIPKDAMLNGRKKMDAENFYFQTGRMHPVEELYLRNLNEAEDQRASVRLKRKCPKCGKSLILRKGYSWFWGCEGFVDNPKCRYQEPL